ncbi:nucleotidyl transferase AbiEii/AbiGii toxin family protein [Mumia zhuanghuii]|uniref:Nucleotidyl transferase AbiEii/AbiGii toxin family protein n=2 Tax=Mumia TaxID=1546255 RepID=A0ABW1QNE2_9ACTN|nr:MULTISPECIES: nucleotidyl transferase AbiEii/AbiGii toxin family protein [Mumia]KAA1423871.1 nucleotidyl transferase AbiEii/AbiGii toxin family protein [Mumia zhuanghuii]
MRDHLISVLLAALATSPVRGDVLFIGGTALARTHLIDFRLSEDIDLLVAGRRVETARAVTRAFERAIARNYGAPRWTPRLETTRGSQPAVMSVEDGRLSVQIQLLAADGYPKWPTEERAIEQRYSDVAPARLRTLTAEAFAAAKAAVWFDRRAPRDLADLFGLARIGAVTPAAAELFARLGPTGAPPGPWMFREAPSEEAWRTALAHQGRMPVGPAEALAAVAEAWQRAKRT